MLIVKYLLRHYRLLLAIIAVSMVTAFTESFGLTLVFPLLQGGAKTNLAVVPFPLNKVSLLFVGMNLASRLQVVALLLMISVSVRVTFTYINALLNSRLNLAVMRDYRAACIDQLMKVGMGYFNKQRFSDLQLIINNYTESAAGAIVSLFGEVLSTLITSILLFAILIALSWKLTLISFFLVVLASFALTSISRMTVKAGARVVESIYGFNKALFDVIHGMKLIRLFNREEKVKAEFLSKVDALNAANYHATKISAATAPAFEVIGIGSLSLLLLVGSFIIVQKGELWLGVLLTFMVILFRLITPMTSLNRARFMILQKLPVLRELEQFLAIDNKSYMQNGTKIFSKLESGITFKAVNFGYNPKEMMVLRDVSFQIDKGMRVGIVGPSGSGKSTLAELLLRFYDPQSGEILIDNADFRDLEIKSWRRRIGVVSQDTFLFNDTIRGNIAFAMPDASDDAVELAARRALAHEFIVNLPQGYDTFVGERGVLLSGGQRQRLSIARAIIAEPEILIFDEATSALDTESEQIVQRALDEVAGGRTVITIAHRLSTVANSDLIIVVDEGRVIEAGSHRQLLNNRNLYHKLVSMQNMVNN